MTTPLQENAAQFFEKELGVTLEALLAPIGALHATGKSVRNTGVYSAIEKARRQDDASLPMGAWEHDLKRADWSGVSALALQALQHQSKDMQLVAWLLEAQIHLRGFSAICACLVMLQNLCERYWDKLYPHPDEGDLEYRANIIRWISEKLLPALRMVALTDTGRSREYAWCDWEYARRNEQLKLANGNNSGVILEGATLAELGNQINTTPSAFYLDLQGQLTRALAAIDLLTHSLDAQFGAEAPGMGAMRDLLQQILAFADAELYKRGVRPAQLAVAQQTITPTDALPTATASADAVATGASSHGHIRDRADAYARLAETADFLMRLEPHSPVPYLVRRATEWGNLNTVELYQELFLKLGGQLNIFEMLGLEAVEKNQP